MGKMRYFTQDVIICPSVNSLKIRWEIENVVEISTFYSKTSYNCWLIKMHFVLSLDVTSAAIWLWVTLQLVYGWWFGLQEWWRHWLALRSFSVVVIVFSVCNRAFMTELFSHHRHPAAMLATTAKVKTEALRSVHVSKSPQAVGLLSVAAVLSLIMWYIFSFLTLFMNKYTLDALHAEPFLFCKYHFIASWSYASEVTSLWRYINTFIIIIIYLQSPLGIQSRIYVVTWYPSISLCVCPSLCSIMGQLQQTSCCSFAAVGPVAIANRRYGSIAVWLPLNSSDMWQVNVGSATLIVYVGSWAQTCCLLLSSVLTFWRFDK